MEAAIRRAEALGLKPRDTLAAIEDLADPAALADPERLAQLAAEMPPPPRGLRGEWFEDNDRRVAIANLASAGLTPAEIARRLSLPIGDVELLLNLARPSASPNRCGVRVSGKQKEPQNRRTNSMLINLLPSLVLRFCGSLVLWFFVFSLRRLRMLARPSQSNLPARKFVYGILPLDCDRFPCRDVPGPPGYRSSSSCRNEAD